MAPDDEDVLRSVRYRQRTLRRNPRYVLAPVVGITVLLGLLLWEVLRDNVDEPVRHTYPWRLTFLGVDTTATLAAAFIGLVVARGQFARTVRPTLGYSTRATIGELLGGSGGPGWTVKLYNGGPGKASIHRVDYWCEPRDPAAPSPEWLSRSAVQQRLGALGVVAGTDYALAWFGAGAPLPEGAAAGVEADGVEVVSFRAPFREALSHFDVRVRVVDVAGDIHERILGCIYTSSGQTGPTAPSPPMSSSPGAD